MQRWVIEGYSGSAATGFVQHVTCSESKVKLLLERLAARHLSEEEVVATTLGNGDEFQIRRDPRPGAYVLMTTGSDYFYLARMVVAEAAR